MNERKKKIVLIPTISIPVSKASVYIPLGLLAIKSYIKDIVDVEIADSTVLIKQRRLRADNNFYNDFVSYLISLEADLYAFSTKTGSYIQSITIAEKLKNTLPNTLVALGGPQASVSDEATIQECNIDFVIRGEGETPFLMIANSLKNNLPINDIPSLTFKTHKNVDASRIESLDSLPIPCYEDYKDCYYDYLNGKPEYDIQSYVPVDSGRGCTGMCKFCYSPAMWKKKYRYKSSKRLFDELEYLYTNFGIDNVFFTEDNFTLIKNRLEEFCNYVISSKLPIKWSCYSRVDMLDKKSILLMKQAGCRQIYYGVESGSKKILEILDKKYTLEEANSIISYTVEAGIEVTASYVVGFVEESNQDVILTINAFADSIVAGAISKLHVIGIEFGSEYYNDVKNDMIFKPSLSAETLQNEYLITEAMYERISIDKRLFSYFYTTNIGEFNENWVKKFRIEYNYLVFAPVIAKIRKELFNDFLYQHVKYMISKLESFTIGNRVEDKVEFFKNSLEELLNKKGYYNISSDVKNEYQKWKEGKCKIKMISKTIVSEK